ncbi:MAG: UvrD-helicase domain-containing protein [Deltaproteobacteria bacterium]|nr:UvrD-helicase domain-containing protein [Deltaproteobacteria bacterium]
MSKVITIAGLNPQQNLAVLHDAGPLLLLAGAGSGKTKVITQRIAYLIEARQVAPENILAVTFTNKAAKEMRERAGMLIGLERAEKAWITTFHALCVRILRTDIEHLGYKRNFSIYGASDQQRLIKDLMNHIDPEHGLSPDLILWKISDAKNRLVSPDKFGPFMRDDRIGEMSLKVYPEYQKSLKSYNAVDFDDLIMLTTRLFRSFPDILAKYQDRFRYIMVDEYQDTNPAQFELVKCLAGKWRNLCVVGDDDQSIYGWRGADPRNILDFEGHFPDSRTIKLEQNYRSTGNILSAANAVIKQNGRRKDKSLWTAEGAGDKVGVVKCVDAEDEARAVIERINHNVGERRMAYKDHAILMRTNAQTLVFEQELRLAGIPYVLIGGQQFFDRKEVKDAIAYLRFIVNPFDEVNLLRILNYPRRGIGRTTADLLIRDSVKTGEPLWKILQRARTFEGLSAKAADSIERFVTLITDHKRWFRNGGHLSRTAQDLFAAIGLEDELRREPDTREKIERRIENIQEIVNAIASYAQREAKPTLLGFLEKVALLDRDQPGTDSKEKKLAQDAVVLMSLHSSKGLEFPQVFMPGFEEGFLPHKKSVSERLDIDEERRLCYVGMTRAREKLTLLHAEGRMKYGKVEPRVVSRFLQEIPETFRKLEARSGFYLEEEGENASLTEMFAKLMGD